MSRARALLLYSGLTVPVGILIHIGAEAYGLHRDALQVAFSPLHAYLGVLGLSALAALGLTLGFSSPSETRRRAALLAQALPFHGRGMAFAALSAGLQFAFFLTTELGEGDPLRAGSLWLGIVVAAIASLIGGLVLHGVRAHLEVVVTSAFEPRVPAIGAATRSHHDAPTFGPYYAYIPARGNRPPPHPYTIHL